MPKYWDGRSHSWASVRRELSRINESCESDTLMSAQPSCRLSARSSDAFLDRDQHEGRDAQSRTVAAVHIRQNFPTLLLLLTRMQGINW